MSGWRYIVQRARTGEFLEWDLPLSRDELSWALSGAGSLRGSLAPEQGGLTAVDGAPLLDEWGTFLYAEASGQIRWGGIVVASEFADGAWQVEAAGFATFPHGTPYLGAMSRIGADPADLVRDLWSYVQAQPHADLGLSVVGSASTPVRLGTPAQGSGGDKVEAEPYELNWWEAPDVGDEIDALCGEGRLEYRESHRWNSDTEQIVHEIELAYPRVGRRRTDLHFLDGENIIEPVAVARVGDEYANTVVGLGAGEGEQAVRATVPGADDGRLRRVAVYSDKGVSSRDRMRTLARGELARRSRTLEITAATVRDHPNAPLGAWGVGDDVLIQADVAWLGQVSLWCRITGWSLLDDHTASLTLARSDSFIYGA